MKKPLQKLPDALVRLVVMFAIVIVGSLVVVKFVIPPRFKDTKIQWADTVKQENAKPVQYAGAVACTECHEEIVAEKKRGYHRDLSCETCHGPSKVHTDPRECSACHGEVARTLSVSHHVQLKCTTCHRVPARHRVSPRVIKPTKPASRDFCGRCHAEESSFQGTPKIELATHGEKYVCWQCHYPHLPEVE
jgi:hypothetical protein